MASRPRWMVGGPSRCGKTHLVSVLWDLGGPVGGFPLEGLFTIYNRRRLTFPTGARERLLEEYLSRPRYIDAERAETEQPLQYMTSTAAQLRAALPADRRHPLAIIGWFLDRFAEENGRATWAAFDLHPEFNYARFRRWIPSLKLAVMDRDPREAVAAALYWRGDPGWGAARDARFKHSLFMYCLGQQTGRALARRWPDDVCILNFNSLISGSVAETGRAAQYFGISAEKIRKAYGFTPDFQRVEGKGFACPDGETRELLSPGEYAEIAALTGAAAAGSNTAGMRGRYVLFARLALTIGRVSPRLARLAADLVYYPRRTVVRRLNNLRQMIFDLWPRTRPPIEAAGESG